MDNIRSSDIVLSLAGHDKRKLYMVMAVDGEFALLADGKIRKTLNPKRKKLRHIAFESRAGSPLADIIGSGGVISDSKIRIVLATYRSKANSDRGGDVSWRKTM